jgi:hypothetical protein
MQALVASSSDSGAARLRPAAASARLCAALLCSARLDAGAHTQHKTSRIEGEVAVTFSKRQSALHSQRWSGLRSVQ